MNEEDYIEQINNLIGRCGVGFDLNDIEALSFLLKRNKQLKEQLQQKENIINKVREFINNNSLYEEEYDYDYEENMYLSGVSDKDAKNMLLEILNDKGE